MSRSKFSAVKRDSPPSKRKTTKRRTSVAKKRKTSKTKLRGQKKPRVSNPVSKTSKH